MRKNLSRREFFQHLTHDLSEKVNTTTVKMASSIVSVPASQKQKPQPEWIAIAKQSEMRPGVKKKVTLENLSLTLHSSGEGIWLEQDNCKRIALRIDSPGVIVANSKIEWPVYRVLSHMTGEALDLVLDFQNDNSKREIT